MRIDSVTLVLAALACDPVAPADPPEWLVRRLDSITLQYRAPDEHASTAMLSLATQALGDAETYIGTTQTGVVTLRVAPDSAVLHTEWRREFGVPPGGFQCWMVGGASRSLVLMLSSRSWSAGACGQPPASDAAVRRLIAHELAHVLHRRAHPDAAPAFPGMSWLYEGVAMNASGQFDTSAAQSARTVLQSAPPSRLADVMNVSAGYPLAGSLVSFVDRQYGRTLLRSLLRARTNAEVVSLLGTDETALLQAWRAAPP